VKQLDFADIHQAKYDLIYRGLPTDLVIDFGASFRPQYINHAARNGAKRSLAIDAHKTELDKGIDFHQANFSQDSIIEFVEGYRIRYPGKCLGLIFDVLLHQYDPLHTIRNLLKVLDSVCLGLPVLKQPNDSSRFLPAIPIHEQADVFPDNWMRKELNAKESGKFAAPDNYGWGNWLWGLNENLLKIWIQREGFDVEDEQLIKRPKAWNWWGCYATRTG
jgi:hypothetical protein